MFQDFEFSLLHKEGYISNYVAHEVLNRLQPGLNSSERNLRSIICTSLYGSRFSRFFGVKSFSSKATSFFSMDFKKLPQMLGLHTP